MDPLSALGVASNVLAVVDFAWTILTEARTIHKSSSGLSNEAEFVDTIANDINLLNQRLLSSNNATGELQVLVTESQKIVSELQDALLSLKTRKKGSKWQSCVAALKETWGRDKVSGLMARLGTLQSRIMMHIQVVMQADTRTGLSKISTAINQLHTTSKALEFNVNVNLSALQNRLLQAFDGQTIRSRNLERDVGELVKYLVDGNSDTQNSKLNQSMPSQLKEVRQLEEVMRELSETAVALRLDHKLLASLRFSQMQDRHYKIEVAHTQTYQWIFQDAISDKRGRTVRFREWLETRSNTFWIHGKPGSGKSTLMKFLVSNASAQTQTHLLKWAGQKKLVIGKFFFWRAGSSLQKSHQGLLRSLLYEILRQCPELMPVAQKRLGITSQWDVMDYDKLLPVLLEAIASQSIPTRFCLFIDGLDEFQDERRSHLDLLKTLRKLEESEDIKLCISSRPWTVFADEFNLDAQWNLKLEDLTLRDIRLYVNDKLYEHSQFWRLVTQDYRYSEIIEAVADRAQGVFLWVFLVVHTLLEGLTYHDSLPTLQRRLESFPPDLEDFFRYLLDSVPKVYRREMVRYFTIAMKSSVPPNAMLFSFLDDFETNPAFLSELPYEPLSTEEFGQRLDLVRRRLDGVSRGLLEIVQHGKSIRNADVDFIHRTVYDFFDESAELKSLFESIRQDENIMLKASYTALAVMKIDDSWGERPADVLFEPSALGNLFTYIHGAIAEDPELAGAMEAMLTLFWANYRYEHSLADLHTRHFMFVRLAANIDFLPYVKSQVVAHPEFLITTADAIHEYQAPLLYQVLRHNNLFGYPLSLRVVECLLVQGSDPNMTWREESLCSAICKSSTLRAGVTEGGGMGALPTRGDHTARKQEAVYHIARLLFSYGANPAEEVVGRDAKYFLCKVLSYETVDKLIRDAKEEQKTAGEGRSTGKLSMKRWKQRLRFLGI